MLVAGVRYKRSSFDIILCFVLMSLRSRDRCTVCVCYCVVNEAYKHRTVRTGRERFNA